ncbi:MAG TPA: hypothetical protein VK629_21485, partial [Steroidobacteraceae bacterium]|nr:hypothetical protein [Steroidobacteraceae bacterium]
MISATSQWATLRDLFAQATELPFVERRSFLDNLSTDAVSLRGELEALLEADECQQKRPLTDAIGAAVGGAIQDRRERLVGSVVGRYKLTEVIGHGGVGTVYLG